MGIFKAFLGNTYIKGETMTPKLRVNLKNVKLFLGNKLRYQMPISGATTTCSTATYNGSTQIAQNISVVLSGQTLTNATDYAVTSNSGGVNAGSYSYTVSGINYFNNSVNGTFKINPKPVTPTITLSQTSYTYNGSQCKPTPTVKDGNTTIPNSEYTVSYSNNTNVGTATCTITDKSGGNYTVSGSKTFTINKVTPTVTPPTAKSLTYNGSAQALVDAGSTNFGTLQYCLNNSGGTYSTSIPSGTNATSYDVWYKVVGDSNINDVAPAKVTVSIAKANPSYTAPTAKSLTYNGNAQALLNAGAVTGGTIYYSSDNSTWSTTIPSGTNANTYTSYWKITGDSNHNDKASASINTTIAKAAGSVTTAPTKKTLTYNNTDQALVNAGSGTGTMMYKLDSGSWGTSIPIGKAAGSYTVYYKASASTNYEESASGSVACSIAKVTPTVTAPTAKSLTYTGNAQALANAGSTNWGTLQYSTTSGGTYSTSIPTGTNAGDYEVWYKVVGNSNINDVAPAKIACSIAKANPTYTAPTKKTELVYNASAQALLNAGSTSHGTIQYSSNGSTWSTTIPTGTNAGSTYKAYWRLVGDSNHNDVASTEISSISIAKVTPTVTAPTPKTLTFNNTNQVLANAGSANYGTIQYCLNNSGGTYSNSVPSASAANVTYKVWYKVVGDSNVNDVAPASIDCMIAEKRVTTPTITLDPTSYTYNGSAQIPTTVTVKDGTTVIPSSEYNVGYSNNTNAGTATVTITDKDAGNYYISGTTAFTISPVTPTVNPVPTAKSLTYNGSAQALVNAGSTNWGTLQYSTSQTGAYNTTIPTQTNAGSYEVWYKVVGDSNINSTNPTKVSCSIAKATGTATVNGTTNTYNGSAKNLISVSNNTGTMHYKVNSGGWSTTLPQATNAGSWTIYYYMDESSNYTARGSESSPWGSVSSSIAKAAGSVTTAPTKKTLTYNGSAQALVNAGSGTGTMMYKLDSGSWGTSIPSATNAGDYTVYYKASASTNYEESASGSVACSIARVTPTVNPVPTAKSLTYNGSAQALVNAGSTNYGTLKYSLDNSTYSTNIPSGTNATTYTVYYRVDGDSNINSLAATSVNVTIAKANPTYTAPAAKTGLVYNRGNQNLLTAGSTSHGTIKYSSDNSTWSTTIPTGKNAVSYTVYWKLEGDSNHNNVNSTTISGISIAKATPVLSTSPTKVSNWTYDGSAHNLLSGGAMKHSSSDTTAVAGTFSYDKATDAGTYTNPKWYFTPTDTTNYNSTNGTISATITVSKADPTYSAPTGKSGLVYNRSSQTLYNAGSNTTPGSFGYTGGTQTNANAGYTVSWKFTPTDTTNYNIKSGSFVVAIAKATPVLATSPTKASNWTYDGKSHALASGGSMKHSSTDSTAVAGTFSYGSATNAGTHTATWSFAPTDTTNYNSTNGNVGTVTVSKADPTYAAPTAKSGLVYSRTSQTLYNAGSNTTPGSFSYSDGARTNAGSQTVSWSFTPTDTTNYNSKSGSFTGSIAKATPVLATSPTYVSNWTYDAAAHNLLSGGSMKHSSSDTTAVAGSFTYDQGTDIGTYTNKKWYFTPTDTTNYNSTNGTVTGSVTCNCKSCTAPTAKSLTYTGSAQALVNAGSTTYGTMVYSTSSTGTFNTTIPTGTNAGSYEVWWKVTGNTNVCCTAATKVACSIAQKAISIPTPTGVSRAYNGSAATATFPAATGAGITKYRYSTNGSSWTESTTNPSQTNVGTLYTQAYYAANNNNYSGSGWTSSATIAISKADQAAPTATGATTTYHNTATATASGGGGKGTLTWTNGSTRTATGTTKTKAYWAGNSNYNASPESNEVSLVVNKATDQSITVTTTNRTYNTSSQVVASATSHGITNYYLGFGSSSTSAPTSWGAANSSISQTNAGTYYIWYKGTADANHSADIGATYKGTVTIGKANQNAPTATGATTTYNTTATATAGGGGGQGSIEWSNGNTQTSVGSKTTKARWTGNSNYNASPWSNEVTVKMNRANRTVSFTSAPTPIIKGNTATVAATASAGGSDGTMSYSSNNTSIATVNGSTITGVASGTCTITATISQGTNYNSASKSYTLSVVEWQDNLTWSSNLIWPSNIPTITSTPAAKTGLVYNGSSQELLSGGTASVPGTFTYGTAIDPGVHTAAWYFVPNSTAYETVSGEVKNIVITYETVDFGLPSGTKWATMNVGANSSTAYGVYFQYGKVNIYQNTSGQTDYDGIENPLAESADAASEWMELGFHMPTKDQWQELINNCTWTWTTSGGTNGYSVSRNGKSIFLPAAGRYYQGTRSGAGSQGYYWSSTPYTDRNAYQLLSASGKVSFLSVIRSYGVTIRGVLG